MPHEITVYEDMPEARLEAAREAIKTADTVYFDLNPARRVCVSVDAALDLYLPGAVRDRITELKGNTVWAKKNAKRIAIGNARKIATEKKFARLAKKLANRNY